MPSSNLDRETALGNDIARLKQSLEYDERTAIAIILTLKSGNVSALSEAIKLAEAIISNSRNSRS